MIAGKENTGISINRRFDILRRDAFTCAYCGVKPGNDRLHVDHLVPRCLSGSDHNNNLITACDRCNNGKGGRVVIPMSLCNGQRDGEGWVTWKKWGDWSLKWDPEAPPGSDDVLDNLCLTIRPDCGGEYWIGLSRFGEAWIEHLREKVWFTPERCGDFLDAHNFCLSLIVL